jgi:hypothetical protein
MNPSVNFVYEFRDHGASPALCCNIDLQNRFIEWSQKPYRRLNPSDNFRDHGTLLLFIDLQNGEQLTQSFGKFCL